MVRSVGRARSQQHGQCECNENRTRRAAIRIRVCFHWGVFRSATEVPHEDSVGIQARMVDLGIRETNWTLVPYGSATRSPSRRPQYSIGDGILIGMRPKSNTARDRSGLFFRVMKRAFITGRLLVMESPPDVRF